MHRHAARLPGRLAVFSAVLALCSAQAQIFNGDFSAGLDGWTVKAFDASFSPIDPTPFVSTVSVGGSTAVKMETGTFSQGLRVAEVSQVFALDPAMPWLSFDFTLPTVFPDATGTGTSTDSDIFSVTVIPNADLVSIDRHGNITTGPGIFNITVTDSARPGFDKRLQADLSPFIGGGFPLTLRFSISQSDDGFLFDPYIDNIKLAAVPEPAAIGWIAGLACTAFFLRRKLARKGNAVCS